MLFGVTLLYAAWTPRLPNSPQANTSPSCTRHVFPSLLAPHPISHPISRRKHLAAVAATVAAAAARAVAAAAAPLALAPVVMPCAAAAAASAATGRAGGSAPVAGCSAKRLAATRELLDLAVQVYLVRLCLLWSF